MKISLELKEKTEENRKRKRIKVRADERMKKKMEDGKKTAVRKKMGMKERGNRTWEMEYT